MSQQSAERDEELRLEIQRFSLQSFTLAKRLVDETAESGDQETATAMLGQLPDLAGRTKALEESERAAVNRSLADARLDLQFVISGGGIPSSIRLGQYMNEQVAKTE